MAKRTAWANIDEIIEALSKKHHIDEEDKALWRSDCSKIYAGHFIIIPDRTKLPKWHLIYIPTTRVQWVYVYGSYLKERTEQVAKWLEVTGPYTAISQCTDNKYFGDRTGFKSFFPDMVVYGGRFFIERVPQTPELYTGPTIQHYTIYATDDTGKEVTRIYDLQDDLPRAKRFAKAITQYAKPASETALQGINALIEETQHAIDLAKGLIGE